MAYGWLGRTGGYQIRLFRSRNLVGPYVDQNGNPAISNGEIPDNQTKDTGIRLTSSVKWSGGPADDDTVEVSQGHNSVLTRGSDGRLFLTYHTRFIDRGDEDYETHVRELLPTDDGWLVAAPYEYTGTKAADMPDPTPRKEKTDRMTRLLATQDEIAMALVKAQVGQTVKVLVEGFGRNEGTLSGRLDNNLTVEFTADASLMGSYANVHLTGARATVLLGELA